MIEDPNRSRRTDRQRREIDIEPHAHPGEPRRLRTSDHEPGWREPVPRIAPRVARTAARDRY